MPELVKVSDVQTIEELKKHIQEFFKKGRYDEITKAIGMHSILIDPERMIKDQSQLYRLVLDLLKNRISGENPKLYSSWLTAFPKLLAGLVEGNQIIVDAAAQNVLASRHAAFGPFASVDEFYFWALDDRRLPLDQIIKYVEKTVELQERGA